jgi:hypothetical protein
MRVNTQILLEAFEPNAFTIDLERTVLLADRPMGADLDIDVRWEGTGLGAQESDRLEFASQSYAIRVARRRKNAGATVTRSVVKGLGTDLMEASFDAFRQATGVDPLKHDSTWSWTETGSRVQVWKENGEHLIANLVAL